MTILHSVTTVAGHNKEAAKKALNQPVVFTHIALGDDDRYPTGGETELGNEVHRGAITGKGTVPGVPNATFFDITVPDDVATFFAREIGLIDEDGVLYALSRYDAPIPKFGPDSANQSAFTFRIIVIFSATANIVIEVDPGWKHTIDAQLRPDFRSAEAIQNDPPVAPVSGQTWVVGLAPTGAWGGHANELAEWSPNGWSFIPPTPWMHVGLSDRTDWRWDHTLVVPAWVQWISSDTIYGPVKLATVAEIESGAAGGVVTADALKARRRPFFVATSGGATNVPAGVDTVLTHFAVTTSFLNPGSSYVGGVFTCGEADAGVWSFQGKAAMVVAAAAASGVLRASFARNGIAAPFSSAYIPGVVGTWSLPDFFTFRLAEGDTVDFRAFQSTGTNRTFDGGSIEAMRIGA